MKLLAVLAASCLIALGSFVTVGHGAPSHPTSHAADAPDWQHLLPKPGEMRLTLLAENRRLSKQYLKRARPSYCTRPALMDSVSRIACTFYTRAGDPCWNWGATTPCLSSICRVGTCLCSFYTGSWVFLG